MAADTTRSPAWAEVLLILRPNVENSDGGANLRSRLDVTCLGVAADRAAELGLAAVEAGLRACAALGAFPWREPCHGRMVWFWVARRGYPHDGRYAEDLAEVFFAELRGGKPGPHADRRRYATLPAALRALAAAYRRHRKPRRGPHDRAG